MKALVLVALAAALVGWGIVPAFRQEVVSAKRAPAGYVRRLREDDARIESALGALKRGDTSRRIEVRSVLAGIHPNDRHRSAFAAALAARGEIQAAYETMRTRVHFSPYGLPYDKELEFYADLAKKSGHPEEAAWARERMGEDGHFRVWRQGEEYIFARGSSHWIMGPDEYAAMVNRHMKTGLELYPGFRDEIEALRTKLLSAP